jgi:hypothetical protein
MTSSRRLNGDGRKAARQRTHSKSWRDDRRLRNTRGVLDCGAAAPLSHQADNSSVEPHAFRAHVTKSGAAARALQKLAQEMPANLPPTTSPYFIGE